MIVLYGNKEGKKKTQVALFNYYNEMSVTCSIYINVGRSSRVFFFPSLFPFFSWVVVLKVNKGYRSALCYMLGCRISRPVSVLFYQPYKGMFFFQTLLPLYYF